MGETTPSPTGIPSIMCPGGRRGRGAASVKCDRCKILQKISPNVLCSSEISTSVFYCPRRSQNPWDNGGGARWASKPEGMPSPPQQPKKRQDGLKAGIGVKAQTFGVHGQTPVGAFFFGGEKVIRDQNQKFLTAREVGEILGLTFKTILDQAWRRKAGLRATRCGGAIRFSRADLDAFLEKGREKLPGQGGAA